MTRVELEKLDRNALMGIAKEKGVKKYIFMKSPDLVNAILEVCGEDAKQPSIVDECQKFYDALAVNNEVEYYAKVDAIVNDRELNELSEAELGEILRLRDEFKPSVSKKETKKEKNNDKQAQPAKEGAEKKSVSLRKTNPILLETERLLAEGKTVKEIAEQLGKSRTYINKCKAQLQK